MKLIRKIVRLKLKITYLFKKELFGILEESLTEKVIQGRKENRESLVKFQTELKEIEWFLDWLKKTK